MSASDYLPTSDYKLLTWFESFSTTCAQRATELKLTPEEIETITAAAASFTASMKAVEAAKAALAGVVAEKEEVKNSSTELARRYAKLFKAYPDVEVGTLKTLGVLTSSKNSPVVRVRSLTVVGQSTGINVLKWDRVTNSSNTIFLVEFSYDNAEDWQFAGALTKTTFEHLRQTPGRTVWYRVTATRSGKSSAPCPPVAVYPKEAAAKLKTAA